MARRKELRYMTIGAQDGFGGTGAVNDASLVATDTVMGVDTLSLVDNLTIVPKGARFTTVGIPTVRTVTATQNSQVFTLDLSASSAGTFDITVNGDTAASQAFDIAAATFQTNLEALTGVGVGNISVVENTDVYTITFQGTLANISTNTLTVDGSSLTASNSHVLTTTQDGTTTWEVTFTPAIATGAVPADDDAITWLPQRIAAKIGEGNLEHTENDDPQIDTDRGILDGVRLGVDQPMEVSMSFVYNWLRASSGDPITLYEALKQKGDASTWVTTADDPCEPYCVDLFAFDRPPCGSEQAEAIFFRKFYKQSLGASVEAAQVSLSGICNSLEPEIFRVANDDDTLNALV